MEEEFATTLRAAERSGNTLTALIRQAWDSGDIRTLTKIPLTATESHISILAHVTKTSYENTLQPQKLVMDLLTAFMGNSSAF